MHFLKVVLVVTLTSLSAHAMDGVCIATIVGGPTYKQWMAPGKLVKYEIKSNLVVKVDSLNIDNAGSPRINASGTYYAFIQTAKAGDFYTRKLVIKPLYGNLQASWEMPLKSMPSWLWWLSDGSLMYTLYPLANGSPTSQNEIRKITLSKVNGTLVATDRMWAKVAHNMQGGFIAIDGAGAKLIYSDGFNGNGGFALTGDTTKPPTSVSIENAGCGYSLSPTGDFFTQWAGGHSSTTWNRWDKAPFPGTPSTVTFTKMVTDNWPVIGPNDPEGKLEVLYNGVWAKDPIGLCGADNIWAENSENWHISEIGAGWLETDADCYNAIAISWKWKKTINISKIMPVKEVMSSRSSFRGITFSGGTQRSADHPTLWCGNQEDVSPHLWQLASSGRQADNQKWSDLLGLPLSDIVGASNPISRGSALRAAALLLRQTPSGHVLTLPGQGRFSIAVFDVAGHRVSRLSGSGSECPLNGLNPGSYVVSVRQSGTTTSSSLVLPQ